MSYNRCKDIHKFGNKYVPSAYKTQVDFRSHFSGKKVCLIVREIRYIYKVGRMFESLPSFQHIVTCHVIGSRPGIVGCDFFNELSN